MAVKLKITVFWQVNVYSTVLVILLYGHSGQITTKLCSVVIQCDLNFSTCITLTPASSLCCHDSISRKWILKFGLYRPSLPPNYRIILVLVTLRLMLL